jgi:hypothetical protein
MPGEPDGTAHLKEGLVTNAGESGEAEKEHKHLMSGVPLKSKVILSPLERYMWYGQMPTKFVLHILIMIVASTLALDLLDDYKLFLGPQRIALYSQFMNTELQDYWLMKDEYEKILQYYSIGDLSDKIQDSVKRYNDLKKADTNKMISMITNADCDKSGDMIKNPMMNITYER